MAKIVIRSEDLAGGPLAPFAQDSPAFNSVPSYSLPGSRPKSALPFAVMIGLGLAPIIAIIAVIGWLAARQRSDSSPESSQTTVSEVDSTKRAILIVLNEDKRLGDTMKSADANITPSQLAERIAVYCSQAEALDLTASPADFRLAYRQHIRAWRDARGAIKELPDSVLDGIFMGAMNSLLMGEKDGGTGRIRGDVKEAIEHVRTTWEEVERIGVKYGAAL